MKISRVVVAVLGLMVLCGCTNVDRSRTLDNPEVNGRTIAQQVCSTCHGEDGNSVSPQYPKLAGQQQMYLTQQLKNFGSHIRTDRLALEIMAGMSHDLTDKQAQEIAEYFYQQKPSNAKNNSWDTSAGKIIYNQGIPERSVLACVSCHGESAQGQAVFPRLAGQHKEYIVKQLHVFKNTHARPDTPMDLVTQNLSEKEIDQVASYLANLN